MELNKKHLVEGSESDHQKALMVWAAYMKVQCPELDLLYSIPNGACVAPKNRKRLVAEGLKRGMPDLHLPVARGPYHSLFLELKTKTGRLSPHQQERMELLEAAGNLCKTSRSFQESITILKEYLGIL